MDERASREQDFWNAVYDRQPVRELPEDLRFLAPLYELEPYLYACAFLFGLLGRPQGRRILSVGGGIDGAALWLARQGANVCCVDVAAEAMAATEDLAGRLGLSTRLRCVVGRCEDMEFHAGFDIVLCRKALHHMSVPEALRAIRAALAQPGIFVAHEPVCLSRVLDRLHRLLPFHPDYPVVEGERALSSDDLAMLGRFFPTTEFHYFDGLTRPSLSYVMGRIGMKRLLGPLGRIDHLILRSVPLLRRASCSVVIRATTHGG